MKHSINIGVKPDIHKQLKLLSALKQQTLGTVIDEIIRRELVKDEALKDLNNLVEVRI